MKMKKEKKLKCKWIMSMQFASGGSLIVCECFLIAIKIRYDNRTYVKVKNCGGVASIFIFLIKNMEFESRGN